MKKIITVIIITIIAILLISSAKAVEEREGYKIKVIKDTIEGNGTEESILFISPEGKIIKRMKKYRWDKEMEVKEKDGKYNVNTKHIKKISENNRIILMYESKYELNYDPREHREEGANKYTRTVKIINARGEERELTRINAYNNGLLGYPFFETDISKDGSTVYVFYMDSTNTYNIEIYDTTGNQLARGSYSEVFELDKQISPDGKIFGGTTYKLINGRLYRHLYFLNVDTGEEKICKAEGEVDGEKWSVSGFPREEYIISISLHQYPQKWRIPFDSLTEDLSVLFQQEGDQ